MKKKDPVYIIPTYYGFMFGFGIIVCFLTATVYANNLAYLLCFFLVALFLIGMQKANSNLKGLDVKRVQIPIFPAEHTGYGYLWITSKNSDGNMSLNVSDKMKRFKIYGEVPQLFQGSTQSVRFKIDPLKRGAYDLHKIRISSRYPFGFFYVWKIFKIDTEYFVYPKPIGHSPLPNSENEGDSILGVKKSDELEFNEHHPYQEGESQRRVDWKVLARKNQWLVKKFNQDSKGSILLDFNKLNGSTEQRLSQLSHWVLECENKHLTYSLSLPQASIQGQRDSALKALALYGESDA